MDNDFYNSNMDPTLREQREQYISDRWSQYHEISNKAAEDAKKFLFLVNAGGAVAVLGFIGASKEFATSLGTKWSLVLFCLGIVCVGVLHIRITHRLYGLFNDWRENVAKYHNQKIGYSQLTNEDNGKTESDLWEFLIGYCSAIAFLVGLIIGGITLFNSPM